VSVKIKLFKGRGGIVLDVAGFWECRELNIFGSRT
jgi:hypothetical protein